MGRGGSSVGRGRGGTRGGRTAGIESGEVAAAGQVGGVEASTGPAPPAKRYRTACDLICWTCDKRGHLSRECPEK